ncbi:MAG: hypothetical protein DLM72_15805, partial [Candidatus Nitrosopolaris wilkensis]
KWIRKKKEFVKLHIDVDAKSKRVVSFRITKGNVYDAKRFYPKEKQQKIMTSKKDKAHNNRGNFNLLDTLYIEPAVEIRNNASTRSDGCHLRRDKGRN